MIVVGPLSAGNRIQAHLHMSSYIFDSLRNVQ